MKTSENTALLTRIMAHDETRARRLILQAARRPRCVIPLPRRTSIPLLPALRGLVVLTAAVCIGATLAFTSVWIFSLLAR
jgi:hypothetical protein